MITKPKPRYRPRLDFLEDRAVPAVDPTVAPQIFSAYSATATAIQQAEGTLSPSASAPPSTASAVGAEAISQILTLEGHIGKALSSSSVTTGVTLLELDSAGLGNQVASLLNTAAKGSSDNTVPQSLLPLLSTAVDGSLYASYLTTAGNAYISGLTAAPGTPSTATTTSTGVAASVGAQVINQILALEQTLTSTLSSYPLASSVIRHDLDAGGLGTQLAALFNVAAAFSPDGSVPPASLPLLYQAVDSAIYASFEQAAGSIYLDFSQQTGGNSSSLAGVIATTAQVYAAYTNMASAIHQAELGLTAPSKPGISVTAFRVTALPTASTTADFVVSLSAPSTSTVTVEYSTVDGTAVAGTDYLAAQGVLTFAPGVTSLSVPITILPHLPASGAKTLMFDLANPTNAIVTTTFAVGTIDYGTLPP